MNNVYLVGFMGTGKSAVGRIIAEKKYLKFIDLDEVITQREKLSIADIFKQKGEPYFRQVEKNILQEVSRPEHQIIACGGGIVLDPENIKLMKATGKIICLTARPDIILRRTNGYAHRPLLNIDRPQEKVEELLKIRSPFYALADLTIDTSSISAEEVAERILADLYL